MFSIEYKKNSLSKIRIVGTRTTTSPAAAPENFVWELQPGRLGAKVPSGSKGEASVGSEDEVSQKLKQLADIAYKF